MGPILLVEDEPDLAAATANVLRDAGFEVEIAVDGLDAIAKIGTLAQTPSVVVMDLNMPRVDGYRLFQWLRSQDAYRTLPVLVVTASRERHVPSASGVVHKPYKSNVLVGMIDALCNRRPVPAEYVEPPQMWFG